MKPKRHPVFPGCVLLVLLFGIFLSILWVGIPIIARWQFGAPAEQLTGFSLRNFGLQTLLHRSDLTQASSKAGGEIDFTIESSESINSISHRLAAAGLIKDAGGFRAYLVYKGLDSRLKAGAYKLDPAMTSIEIAERLQAIYSPIVPFFIYPGWRAEEIAAALPSSGIEVSPEEFLAIVHNPSSLAELTPLSEQSSLNGFLFPGAYQIERKISPDALVLTFVNRFFESVNPGIVSAIHQQGISLYEGITLASIIQRETFEDEERALMASVFYNRLRDGIKLETDPTVQYALGYSAKWGGWWKTPLQTKDLEVDSPYNTYVIQGLPPAPISNPELSSIMAVAYPEESSFYFFRAKCDNSGYHDFSITFAEHLSKECK